MFIIIVEKGNEAAWEATGKAKGGSLDHLIQLQLLERISLKNKPSIVDSQTKERKNDFHYY